MYYNSTKWRTFTYHTLRSLWWLNIQFDEFNDIYNIKILKMIEYQSLMLNVLVRVHLDEKNNKRVNESSCIEKCYTDCIYI